MNKSFQLIRTNPRLTTNIKLVVSSDDNLYLESFDSNKELSDQKYKHKLLNNSAILENEFPKFYDKLPKNLAFTPKSEYDVDIMYNRYENQFDSTYFSGAKQVEDQWYKEEFEYFAPLYIKKNSLPQKFIILRVDDAAIYELDGENYILGSLSKDNFRNEILDKWKCVSVFDLTTKTNIGSFLDRNINSNDRFPEFSFFFDTKKYNYSKWSGLDYNSGVYTTSELFLDDKLYYENYHFNLEEFITNGFEQNNIVYPYILNFKFLFDDSPGTPDKFNKYSMNRYYGFYSDKFELVKSVTTSDLLTIKNNLVIKNNIFLLNNVTVNPFVNELNKSGWIQILNNVYYVTILNNGSFKVISDIDLTNVTSSSLNHNICKIQYNNGKNYITFEDPNFNIDPFVDPNGKNDSMYADLYLIEIDGIFHILKSEKTLVDNTYIHSYYIHSDYAIISNAKLLKYWRGGESNNITKSIFDSDGKPLLYNIYKVKFTDVKDFDFDRIVTKYSDFDYEKSTYVTTPEVKLNTNEYRDNTIPRRKKIHEKNEKGQYKLMNISSEYSAGDETFEIRLHDINPMWEKNQSICKWHYDGSISHSDYPYKLNNSLELSGVYNKTTNTDIIVSNIKEKSLDYFYRIGEFYGKEYDIIIEHFEDGGSGDIKNWTATDGGWLYTTGNVVESTNNTINGNTLVYNYNIEKDVNYYVYLKLQITSGNTLYNYSAGISPSSFLNATITTIGQELIIEFIGVSQGTELILVSDYTEATFYDIILKKIENKYYLNQSTNIQTNLHNTVDKRFNLQMYIDSNFNYFEYFFDNIMYYEDNGILYKKPYKKYSHFIGGDNDLPCTSLFKGIEYKLYRVEDMVINNYDSITGKETIRTIITQGGKYYNGYKMSVIINENYKHIKYDKTESSYSNPTTVRTISTSVNDTNNILEGSTELNGLHVIVNDVYKNVLIIINSIIPINQEWNSLNNVDVFGENYGLYYGKTKDNTYLMPITSPTTPKEYNPNNLVAFNYMKSLNNLNDKGVFDEFVTYYNIDTDKNVGKVIMTKFSSKSNMSDLSNWTNNFPPFHLQVDKPLELKLKKNSYNNYASRGPSYNIYNKYTVYSKNIPLSQSIIDQPLSRYIDINNNDDTYAMIRHGEKPINYKNIKRFIGYYEPIFNDIIMFKPLYYWESYGNINSVDNNYVFADDLDQFSQINEQVYSKVNESNNYLKLKNVDIDKSIYPMVDEIGLSQTKRNIMLSTWDRKYYIKTLNEQTLLSNYIEIPVYVIPYETIGRIVSVIITNPLNLSSSDAIYGFKKSQPSNNITYNVTVKNLSIVGKSLGVKLNYIQSNYTTSTIIENYTPIIAPNDNYTFTFTCKRPDEIQTGVNLTEFTSWTALFTCFDISSNNILDTNTSKKFNIYNDLIHYNITSVYIPPSDQSNTTYTQGNTINGVTVTFKDTGVTTINNISSFIQSNYIINMYLSPYVVGNNNILLTTKSGVVINNELNTISLPSFTIPSDGQTEETTSRNFIFEIIHNYTIYDVPNTRVFDSETSSCTIRKVNILLPNMIWYSTNIYRTVGYCIGNIYEGDNWDCEFQLKNIGNAALNLNSGEWRLKYELYKVNAPDIILNTSYSDVSALSIGPNSTKVFHAYFNTFSNSTPLITQFNSKYYIKVSPILGISSFPPPIETEKLFGLVKPNCRIIDGPTDPGDGCVEENTLIKMYDGTYKMAKDINVGDKLISFKIDGSSNIEKLSLLWYSDKISGKIEQTLVKSISILSTVKYYNINNGLIKCTGDHPILIQDDNGIYRWCNAVNIKPGYNMFSNTTLIKVKTIAIIFEKINIVRIDVEEVDNFFTFNGILSHNKPLVPQI